MYAGEIVEYGLMEDIFDAPVHHPYTVGLFGAIPSLDSEVDRLYTIDGLMPDPTNLPSGCKFMERCPKAMSICKQPPSSYCISGLHQIKCHLFSDVSARTAPPIISQSNRDLEGTKNVEGGHQ
jgi:peptide/nickel transport system ATP-binding protein